MARSNQKPPVKSLADLGDAPEGLYSDPIHKFAEIYGSSMVGQARLFILSGVMGVLALASIVGMFALANKSTVTPWIVEVNDDGGVRNRPVRMENIRPNQAVIKSELAKFITNVFTIDPALTPQNFKRANVMTTGLATSQFSEFRSTEKIATRLSKEPDSTRMAKVSSVDISQPGVAFVFLTTEESRGSTLAVANAKWRVTLKYQLTPPKTEKEILDNPLGLFVTGLNITKEGNK